jgi:hypothetical protein
VLPGDACPLHHRVSPDPHHKYLTTRRRHFTLLRVTTQEHASASDRGPGNEDAYEPAALVLLYGANHPPDLAIPH